MAKWTVQDVARWRPVPLEAGGAGAGNSTMQDGGWRTFVGRFSIATLLWQQVPGGPPVTPDSMNTVLQAMSAVLLAVVVYMLKGILDEFRELKKTVNGPQGHGERIAVLEAVHGIGKE